MNQDRLCDLALMSIKRWRNR